MALTQEFRFAVSTIDKTHRDWMDAKSQSQHWACATELAALMRRVYSEADEKRGSPFKEPIVVDDNADRLFLKTIKSQFRALQSSRPGVPFVGKVSFSDSAKEPMLQLVDMVCGAVGSFVDEHDATWYDMIAGRDVEARRLP